MCEGGLGHDIMGAGELNYDVMGAGEASRVPPIRKHRSRKVYVRLRIQFIDVKEGLRKVSYPNHRRPRCMLTKHGVMCAGVDLVTPGFLIRDFFTDKMKRWQKRLKQFYSTHWL